MLCAVKKYIGDNRNLTCEPCLIMKHIILRVLLVLETKNVSEYPAEDIGQYY